MASAAAAKLAVAAKPAVAEKPVAAAKLAAAKPAVVVELAAVGKPAAAKPAVVAKLAAVGKPVAAKPAVVAKLAVAKPAKPDAVAADVHTDAAILAVASAVAQTEIVANPEIVQWLELSNPLVMCPMLLAICR